MALTFDLDPLSSEALLGRVTMITLFLLAVVALLALALCVSVSLALRFPFQEAVWKKWEGHLLGQGATNFTRGGGQTYWQGSFYRVDIFPRSSACPCSDHAHIADTWS